jgi:hypothetical protein
MPWTKADREKYADKQQKGVRHGTGTARQTPRRTIAGRAGKLISGSSIGGGKRKVG